MKMIKAIALAACCVLAGGVSARTFEFKIAASGKSQNEGDNNYWRKQKTKFVTISAKVGKPSKKDCLDEMELRAATVMRDVRDKRKTPINDIKIFKFLPINDTALNFKVVSATASASIDRDKFYYDSSYGSEIGALVVEFWQGGKCVKHWASATGPVGKVSLTDKVIEEVSGKCVPGSSRVSGTGVNGSSVVYYSYFLSGDTRLDKDERVTKIILEKNEEYEKKLKAAEEEADKALQEEELKPSGIAPAMFLSEANHAPVVYKADVVLMDSNHYAVPQELRETHWCVQLCPEIIRSTDGNGNMFIRSDYLYGLVTKDSALGKRMKIVIQDGRTHPLLVKVAHHRGAEVNKVVDILNFKPVK